MLNGLISKIKGKSDPEKAEVYQRFFKSGKGEYGEGDRFLGISVPDQREIAKEFVDLDFEEIKELLDHEYHEHRMIGFFILVYKFLKSDEGERRKIVDFYLENIDRANNWDLIDCVCDKILGGWLIDRDKDILYEFSRSDSLWRRRISIISTFEFIKNNKFKDGLKISEILLDDDHDLIHKAVGWMLREIGKRDVNVLEDFLEKHYKNMPRTMLRYAIEKFDGDKRKRYLKGEV
ncbi:DNA alkylation repair protein [Candidatus Pacearchaeota archaeon]|nr:DNA alkylation repair protein [Candidatus Pacearchaeota archaeon]